MSDSDAAKQSRRGGGCPIDHSSTQAPSEPVKDSPAPHSTPACPIDHTQRAPSFAQTLLGKQSPGCPVDDDKAEINPLNMMPNLGQQMHTGQTEALSTDREVSSIPRANTAEPGMWEYPSPQQFYNALARKNMAAPEKYVDVMVDIHNFLNEGAWNEVLKWEARHRGQCMEPRLLRLQGRPRDLSPMARISSWIHGVKPFDRHDWYVDRCGKQVRYVIDYYEGVPENDMPVFNLVVRPAIDDVESLADRAKQLWDDAKQKYFGSQPKQ
ncbi:holocytochrome c synthase [Coemansia sp. Benny D115]|nr:holocytochrome c synthase [Coemansia sp. Benny D115]